MADLLIGIAVLAIVGAAVFYIVREKKKGVKCVGCPYAGNCAHAGAGKCDSHTDTNEII